MIDEKTETAIRKALKKGDAGICDIGSTLGAGTARCSGSRPRFPLPAEGARDR
jgi:hypothetical protein